MNEVDDVCFGCGVIGLVEIFGDIGYGRKVNHVFFVLKYFLF